MNKLEQALISQGVDKTLLKEVQKFREQYPCQKEDEARLVAPDYTYYGKRVWEMAITALLLKSNILLSGPKATGKNVLADGLTCLFGRPGYNISFNVTTDSTSLIGTDTFSGGEVRLRLGPVYRCALSGGFGVFDEVNMAKNDAVSVLHSALDHRRIIDVPGYDKIRLNDATRFIGTMNYGYAGTRELNEALVSRFMVVDMPALDEDTLMHILFDHFPLGKKDALSQFCGLFLDLQKKASNGEISTKSVDLRGMIGAISAIASGLDAYSALSMGITNKTFDVFERDIITDALRTRIPEGWNKNDIF